LSTKVSDATSKHHKWKLVDTIVVDAKFSRTCKFKIFVKETLLDKRRTKWKHNTRALA
jgi:hypothetical protein